MWIKALLTRWGGLVLTMDVLLFGVMLVTTAFAQPPAENKTCSQGNLKKAAECCPLPRLMNKTIADKCNQEFKNRSSRAPPGVRQTEGSCLEECIFRTIGGYNVTSKTLDVEAVRKELLKTAANAKAFLPLFNSSIDYCYPIISKDPQYLATPVSLVFGQTGCSFLPSALLNCIKIELFKKCPKNRWLDAADCDQLKEKLTTGCLFSSIANG